MRNCTIANHPMYTIFEDGSIHSGKLDKILSLRKNANGYLIATLDGKELLWQKETSRKRSLTATKNLEKINAKYNQ